MDMDSSGQLVLSTLTQACSQNAETLKPAEQRLREWETQPGFHTILLSIFKNHNIDVNVRWLAVLYFKNGVDKYWRKMAPNAISEDEKSSLRQSLIASFDEPIHQIATQLSVLIGKIARLDCPRNWSELIPTLLSAVRCDDALSQQRALLTLHHVTKTLASKRLAHDRRVFEELTLNVFEFLLTLWNDHTELFITSISNGSQINQKNAMLHLDNSLLALKVLRKLGSYGFRDGQKAEMPTMLINLVFQRVHQFAKSKNQIEALGYEFGQKREKIIVLLTKVLLDVQEMQPETYVPFIRQSLEMAVSFNFTDEGAGIIFERFTVNSFNLMRSILRCETYRPAKIIEALSYTLRTFKAYFIRELFPETKNPKTLEAHKVKLDFFTVETLTEVCKRLVHHYFQLPVEDLHIWDTDPEEFVIDEGGDSWKFSLRPCTENLYLTLMKEFRETLAPCVVGLGQACQGQVDPNDMAGILRKDAVYNAIGQASFDLYDEVDFNQWFTSQLIPELRVKHTNYRIIRRRVIWLVGCWTGVKLSADLRPTLYEEMQPLLQQDEDLVVRIETALTLKYAVDDFEFKSEQFFPYLERTFGLLFQLLKDVDECETKMQVLHVISFLIERMETSVRPYAGALIQYLPMLWDSSAEHNMLRCAILTTLVFLVQGLGEQCVSMYSFLLPVIQLATDVSQEPHVYLMEDGLDLWQATLHCSPVITPDLLALYHNMPSLLEYGSETLHICMSITEAYILIGTKDFMQTYSQSLVQSFTNLFNDLRSEGIIMVMKVVEKIFIMFPEDGPRIFADLIPYFFKNVMEDDKYPMEVSMNISLIARVILQNQPFFIDTLDKIAVQYGRNSEELIGSLLDSWVDKSDSITHPERMKLSAMATASLISSNISAVLQRFGHIISICVETLHDIYKIDGDLKVDVLVIASNEFEEFETPHEKRKKELSLRDPVMTIDLRHFILTQLKSCQNQQGPDLFNQLMDLVDPDISRQLQLFIQNAHATR